MENTASGAQLNNDLIQQVLDSTVSKPEQVSAKPTPPSETLVALPAGYINSDGEAIRTAEVRELTGRDEEAIGKLGGGNKAYSTILGRATVKLGDDSPTEALLESLVLGDRDALMLGIYRATFGKEVELPGYCSGCDDFKTVGVDLDRDVEMKVLTDPIADRTFIVEGRNKQFLVTLPTGVVQKELIAAEDKGAGERNTILLQHCVLEIDGSPVIGKGQVQDLGVLDRNKIASELNSRLPGPQFQDIVLQCPDCEGEVVVPFNLGALFRL